MSRAAVLQGARRLWPLLLACGLAAGCSEKAQVIGSTSKKTDLPAFQSEATPYTATGWKAGDSAAWEAQIRSRNQGQNEYSRAPAAAKAP